MCACDRVEKPVLSIIIDNEQPSKNSGAFEEQCCMIDYGEGETMASGTAQHGRLLTSDNRYLLLRVYNIYTGTQHTSADVRWHA
jgi:hypothetical protein